MSLTTFFAYSSGVALVAPTLEPGTALGTSLAVLICHAIVCRLFAYNRGYQRNLWMAFGALAGVWAVAILILLPRRTVGAPPQRPLP